MKLTTMIKRNSIASTSPLWTPLPDCQQELLSGGAPTVPPPPAPKPISGSLVSDLTL